MIIMAVHIWCSIAISSQDGLSWHAGEPAEYLLIDGHLQEVNWYKERYRSWFIGDSVLEDGSMYLCTPVDPLFLALPLMESNRMQVMPPHLYFRLQDALQRLAAPECTMMHATRRALLAG